MMSINEKLPKSRDPANPNQSDPSEGATVVRKLDVERLAREAAAAGKRERVASRVNLISFRKGTYLLAPIGVGFSPPDGDSVREDGISEGNAKQTILSLFGSNAYLEPDLWARVIRSANAGVKVVLEVGEQPLISPRADINGKFPIRIRG